MKNLIGLLILGLSLQAQASWDLNDVSYLMPLPKVVGQDNLIKISTETKSGALLPTAILNQLPPLDMRRDRSAIYSEFRVVGVRIDACFPYPTLMSCQKQIRLMWQPIREDRSKQIVTVDAAIHTFYELNDEQFATLLGELKAWKAKFQVNTLNLPLQVHPAWAAEQDQAPALSEFNGIILKYMNIENMMRLTIMALRGNNDMWMFVGYEPKGEKLQVLAVPRLGDRPAQAFRNGAVPADKYEYTNLGPAPEGADTINHLITDSNTLLNGYDNVILTEMNAAKRIENPKIYNPETMDCVSCHTTQGAISWVDRNRSAIKPAQGWSPDIYTNFKFNLKNISPVLSNTQNLRAFGYFGSDVAISQRMINESAEVAEQLNSLQK